MNHNGQDREFEDELIHELLKDLQTLDRVVPEKHGPSAESWELVVKERWRMLARMRRWEVLLFCIVALLMVSGGFLFALSTPVIYGLLQGLGVIAAVVVALALRPVGRGRTE
ncbi:DUF5345 family protein [Paenibacillus woosongensis]|uniref:DUF5345 family protein n=1 Tax=Paenibacillus woosongensis TaxID=307580 RepID=A0AA95I6G4_9BACL|nr:DUF5345 family protein [Paenibacillus woosongensis]WHX48409.1 DUF5345 family protein [Paenibacillus woosongensis]